MKKKSSPKLRLDKETLRTLEQTETLAGIAGGCGATACGCGGGTFLCSDSVCVNLCP